MAQRRVILIADDDDALRKMYRMELELGGFEVQEARNGLDALYRIDSDPPDAILLDIEMPLVSGVVVRQDIAARAATRDIPVIVLTGSAEDFDWLDVACVLRKPLPAGSLVEAVVKCIG
jgi:two-component system phosphate regulon response regulator PhoB